MITEVLLKEINKLESTDEVKEVWDILKNKYTRLTARNLDAFYVGQTVQFKSRAGELVTGVIERLHQKSVNVRVGDTKWTVSGNLLIPLPARKEKKV